MGSWKTMAISLPRRLRIAASPSVARSRRRPSRPRNVSRPPAILPGGLAIKRMRESPVTDLPDPDSPTITGVSPLAMAKESPSTARSLPSSVANSTWRSSTSSSGAPAIGASDPPPARIKRIAQGVAEQVEADHHGEDRQAGEGGDPPGGEEIALAIRQQRAPVGRRRLGAEAEEGEPRRLHHHGARLERGHDQ